MRPRGGFSGSLRVSGAVFFLSFASLLASAAAQTKSSDLLSQAETLLQEMSEVTGLPIKGSLKKQVVSRTEIQNHLTEGLRLEYTPQELRVQEATLQAFGLVSSEFNLEKFLISFFTEQAVGFYDPRSKTMFIADWPDEDMQKMVLAHELTHVLQDQNFDLLRFLRAARGNDDAANARQAVAEGYVMAAMMQRVVKPIDLAHLPSLEPMMAAVIHRRMEELPAFSNAPLFFRMQALFPYMQGMSFMQCLLRAGGWMKLSQLFVQPPATTKEIFEPSLYLEGNSPPSITLPRPAPLSNVPGLRLLAENAVGELGYYAVLGQLISEDEAKSVGTGWLADRYIIYEGPAAKRYVLVARTRWSSTDTALAFFRDYHTILAHKYPELVPDRRTTTDLFVGSTASGQVMLLRKGDEVLWAEGIPTAEADAMLEWLQSL